MAGQRGLGNCALVAASSQQPEAAFRLSVKIEKGMKRKTTIYIDDSVLRALKIAATRSGQHDYELVEQALRSHLGLELLQRTGAKPAISENKAMKLAYEEVHRSRKK